MIIGGAYPGGYTPLGLPSAAPILYRPKFGGLRVSLGNALNPALTRLLGQFGVDAILYVADRSTKQSDGSTQNGAWLAIPDAVPVVLSTITEADKVRDYGSELDVDIVGQMPIPSGIPILPGMAMLIKTGGLANTSFRIVDVRPSSVANIARVALTRLKTPIA